MIPLASPLARALVPVAGAAAPAGAAAAATRGGALTPAPIGAALAAAEPGSASVSGVGIVLGVAAALILAFVLAEVLAALTRSIGRRTPLAESLARRARRPLRVLLVLVLVWIALRVATPGGADRPGWMPPVEHVLLIGVILAGAWLIGSLLFVVEDLTLARYRTDTPDNRHARRVRTQVMVLRRLTVLVLVVAAIAGALLTFEGARVAGAGVLASAGLLSVVAGLAAQTSLANVFAGLQLAFTDAIRVDDVVVVEDQWGRIEEITMTYVVVHVWDDRRLILPSTYFTTTPFENWTRRAADLLGTVELDLDWAVPVAELREELTRLLQASELWDHRVGVLQVTEATGGLVRVRALASAADAPTLFDLRCAVREGLVGWLQREHPEALPRSRWETVTEAPASVEATADEVVERAVPQDDGATELLDPGKGSRLFTGSVSAVARSRPFAGPGEDVIAEREHTAEGLTRSGPVARVSYREVGTTTGQPGTATTGSDAATTAAQPGTPTTGSGAGRAEDRPAGGPSSGPDVAPATQPIVPATRRDRRVGRDDETMVMPRDDGPGGDS